MSSQSFPRYIARGFLHKCLIFHTIDHTRRISAQCTNSSTVWHPILFIHQNNNDFYFACVGSFYNLQFWGILSWQLLTWPVLFDFQLEANCTRVLGVFQPQLRLSDVRSSSAGSVWGFRTFYPRFPSHWFHISFHFTFHCIPRVISFHISLNFISHLISFHTSFHFTSHFISCLFFHISFNFLISFHISFHFTCHFLLHFISFHISFNFTSHFIPHLI